MVLRHEGPHWGGRRLGLVHTVRGTAGRVNDVVEANSLLHGEETEAWGDPATRVQPSGLMHKMVCAGTSPYARSNAGRWTRAT